MYGGLSVGGNQHELLLSLSPCSPEQNSAGDVEGRNILVSHWRACIRISILVDSIGSLMLSDLNGCWREKFQRESAYRSKRPTSF